MSSPPPSRIPDVVRRFVLANVPSIPFLEAARLLHSTPHAAYSAQSLAAALYVKAEVAQKLLWELKAAGITAEDDRGYRYAPRDDDLTAALEQLFTCYQADLVGISNLVHDATRRNAERFADAFKWRKDRRDG